MEDKEDHSKRPEDTNFKQQRLKAWQPLLTPPWVIGTFIVIGIVFIPLGAVIFHASNGVVENTLRYDDLCAGNTTCQVTVSIDKDMSAPIYFYYQLTNFYQNHRRYVKSRSDDQLAGSDVDDTAACDPLEDANNGLQLYPCGLIANSFFNDSYSGFTDGGNSIFVDETNIAWQSDINKKFDDLGFSGVGGVLGHPELTRNSTEGFVLPSLDNEHFIVWMRTAGLPTFKKLWGKIGTSFNAGDTITLSISNNFPVASFNGEKAIVFSTTSWLGGKNDFLGIAYLSVGCLCIALGVIFAIKHCCSPRPLGNMEYLHWPGKSNAAAAH